MNKYPKIGIRPTIDGRQGGVRESLEEKTMNLARSVGKESQKGQDNAIASISQNVDDLPSNIKEHADSIA